eukprot:9038727-Lingulodinium_polyedra.AAC.1
MHLCPAHARRARARAAATHARPYPRTTFSKRNTTGRSNARCDPHAASRYTRAANRNAHPHPPARAGPLSGRARARGV